MWTGQRRATRGFLLVSAAALTVPAVIVGWLGWLLLQSDRELDRQRVQERLTNAAILAIASLEQAISATEQRLTALASAESPVRPPEGFESLLEADAALVVISATEIWFSAPLLYYPGEIDFTDSVADAFVAGERLEFAQKDLASALDSYRALADSRDRAVRAGALGRMARVARKLDRPKMALEAYDALAPLGSTMVLGRPADLVASLERCAVLQEMNEHDRLAREARQFDRRLTSADWRLSASQFHFYRGLVDEWLDDTRGEAEDSVADRARSHRRRCAGAAKGLPGSRLGQRPPDIQRPDPPAASSSGAGPASASQPSSRRLPTSTASGFRASARSGQITTSTSR